MYTRKNFSYGKALRFAFASVKDHIPTIVALGIFWLALQFLVIVTNTVALYFTCPTLIAQGYFFEMLDVMNLHTILPQCAPVALRIAQFFLIILINIPLLYLFIRFALSVYDGRPLSLTELFTFKAGTFFNYCGAFLLWYAKVFGGLLLLVFPGIYFTAKYIFAGYSLLDSSSQTIKEDTKLIADITEGVRVQLYLVLMATTLLFIGTPQLIRLLKTRILQLIGFLNIGIALSIIYFVVYWLGVSLMYFTMVHIYKQLKEYTLKNKPTSQGIS